MPQYVNTFNAKTPIGQSLGSALNAMYSMRSSPRQESMMAQRDALASKYKAETDAKLFELAQAKKRAEMMNPANYANIAATMAGVPLSEVQQEQDFIQGGAPLARPDWNPATANTISKTLGGLMAMPLMGNTNYEQFMGGVSSGRNMGMSDAMLTGDLDPQKVAQSQAAMAGKPTLDVKGDYAFNPYGSSIADVIQMISPEDNRKSVAITGDYAYDPYGDSSDIVSLKRRFSGATPQTSTTPIPSTLPNDVDYSQATGSSGFWGNKANTITGLFGKEFFPEVERGGQALTNLQVRTQTGLQQAIPGRPSNYLMEQIRQLTVDPYSMFQGDDRSVERLRQTRDMIQTELFRMEKDILSQPHLFGEKDISDTQESSSVLKGLLADYNTVLDSFGGGQSQNQPIQLNSADPDGHYDSLPVGATYIGPDGIPRTK